MRRSAVVLHYIGANLVKLFQRGYKKQQKVPILCQKCLQTPDFSRQDDIFPSVPQCGHHLTGWMLHHYYINITSLLYHHYIATTSPLHLHYNPIMTSLPDRHRLPIGPGFVYDNVGHTNRTPIAFQSHTNRTLTVASPHPLTVHCRANRTGPGQTEGMQPRSAASPLSDSVHLAACAWYRAPGGVCLVPCTW